MGNSITLTVGETTALKSFKDHIAYAGMPSENVYFIVQMKNVGAKDALVSSIINRFNHLTAFARICSAFFVHTKGFAPSFHRARKAFIAAMRWATLSKLPLRIAWLVSMPNQISTIFIQDAPVGVK